MEQLTIRYRIHPDGRVDELVEGLNGMACEQLTERIEARLGVVQQRRSTAEAFICQQQEVQQSQVQSLS
ncbi:MAG: DUF2997 domain-containing protein [Cyanobium sp. MAG_237]|jgi:hypothetical protein|uniref:DUF2997 domain-containing protein n=1 Tax=Cyanobium usitatum TaxID=2304190 RepID=UPI00278F6BF9|nr:DUF2997 domain-containing protein [Cyanobium usitatum]MDP4708099.1 DUF2997 domain-containing protein [Cyanobium sp. MAG_237]CAK6687421.1 hypothetical protein OGCDGJMD_00219 [Cyanobium usitatum str. Tous]